MDISLSRRHVPDGTQKIGKTPFPVSPLSLLPYNKPMRTWSLNPQDPRSLTLSADFRFCEPDYINDHTWEIEPFRGDAAVLGLRTSYGLQARSMRIFPAFTINGKRITNPASFFSAPRLESFYPNYLSFTCSPFEKLDVRIEIWVPSSTTIASRVTLDNQDFNALDMQFEVIGLLQPIEGSVMAPVNRQFVNILSGKTADLRPVIFLTGGPEHGANPHPSLLLNLRIPALSSRKFTWAQAALADEQASFDLARRTAARPWDAEISRIRIINEAQSVEFETGDPDWDAALVFSQTTAFRLFFPGGDQFPQPAFVLARQPDHGWSSRGDGLDHVSDWNGFSPLDAVFMASLLPAAPGLAAGLLRNFLSIQAVDGFVDCRPGLAGQRGHWLAAPILASLAWQNYQSTGDRGLIAEIFNNLLAFLQKWFEPAEEGSAEKFPAWGHPRQAGLDEHPAFSRAHGSNPLADIRFLESPGLAALLWKEFQSLEAIAAELGTSEELEDLRGKVKSLPAFVKSCFDPRDGRYHYRDRESHRSPSAKPVLTATGEGSHDSKVKFKDPERLLIVFHTFQPSRRGLTVTLHGLSADGSPRVEVITNKDLTWEPGTGYSATAFLYTAVKKVEVSGLTRSGKMVITTVDASFTDPTCILPLWAGLTGPDETAKLIGSIMPVGSGEIHLSSKVKEDFHFPWLQFLAEGLLDSGRRNEAAELVSRMMELTIRSLKQQGAFFAAYSADEGDGVGERNNLHGLAPLGLFLKTLGVQIISPRKVRLEGISPFPWQVTLRHRGLFIVRDADRTEVTFPDGRTAMVTDAGACIVSIE